MKTNRRWVALTTLLLFLCGEVSPLLAGSVPAIVSKPTAKEIFIPSEWGRVEEYHQGTSGRTLYFIQDAHDSLEIQENIARLIHYLVAKENVDTVFEEGFDGPVPTDEYFNFIDDPLTKERVSHYLLNRLEIGGAEYAHINRQKDFQLIGADNRELQLKTLQTYRDAAVKRKIIEEDLSKLEAELERLAAIHFPDNIKQWMKIKKRYGEGDYDIVIYLQRIQRLFGEEIMSYLKQIKILLQASAGSEEHLSFIKLISPVELFDEVNRLESSIRERFLDTANQKTISQYYQVVQSLKRLNAAEISFAEFKSVQSALENFRTEQVVQFIAEINRKSLVLSKEWERHAERAREFYELASQRDLSVRERLRIHKFNNAVLVYGGFHKSNLKTILKDQGHTFYVISPRMTEVSSKHAERYRELMAGGLEGFERGFSLNRLMRYLPVMAADYWNKRERAQLRILHLKNRLEGTKRSELREYDTLQENFENFYIAVTTLESSATREDGRSRKEVFISFSNYLWKKFEVTTSKSINAEELYEIITSLIEEKHREIPNYRARRDYFFENFHNDFTVRFMEHFAEQNPAILLTASEEALHLKPARRWPVNIWFHKVVLAIKQNAVFEAFIKPFAFGRIKDLFQRSHEELMQRLEVLERARRAFREAPFSYMEYSLRVRPYLSKAEEANVQLEVLGEIKEPVAISSNRAKFFNFNLRAPVIQDVEAEANEKIILVGEDELVLYPVETLGRQVLSTVQAKCCGVAAGEVKTGGGDKLYLMSHQLPTGFALTLNVLERLFHTGQIQSADLVFIVSDRETKLDNLQRFKERYPGFNFEVVESHVIRRGVTLSESARQGTGRYMIINWEEPWVRYSDETPIDFSLGYSTILRDRIIEDTKRSEVREDNQAYLTASVINKGWSNYKNELSEGELEEFRFVAEGLETKEDYLAELERLNDPTVSFVSFRELIDKIDAYPKEKFRPLHNYLWDQTAQFFLDTAQFGDDEEFKEARMKFLQPYISFHIMSSGDKTREELSKRALLAFSRHYDRNIFYPAFHELLNNLLAFGRTYSEMNFSEVPAEKRRIIDLTVELLTADSNSPGYAQAISNLLKWMWGHITAEDQKTRDSFKKVLNYVLHNIERRRPELAQTIRIMYERGSQKGVITKTVLEGIGFWTETAKEGDSVSYSEYADVINHSEEEDRFTLSPDAKTLGFDEDTINEILQQRSKLGAVYEKNFSMALRLGKQYRTFATIDSDHALTSIDFEFYDRVKHSVINGLSEPIINEFNRIHRYVWFTRGVELHGADPTFSRRALYRRDTLVTSDLLEDSYKNLKEELSQIGIHSFNEYFFAYILYLGRFVNGKDGYLAALLLEYYYQTTFFDQKGDVIPALREAEELLRKSLQDILSHSPKFHVRDANWMESDGTRIAQSVYWVDSATWPDRRPVVVVPSLGPQDISSRAIAYTIVQKGYVVLVYDISGFGRTIPYKYDHFYIGDYVAARGEGIAHIMQESYKKAPAELNRLLDRIAHWPQADRHRIAIAGHHGTQWFVNLFNPNPDFRPHLADMHGETLSEISSLQTRIQHVWFVRSPQRFNDFYDPLLQATPHNVQLDRLMKFPEFLNAAERDLPIKVFADLSYVSRVLKPHDPIDQLEAIRKIISGERVIREVIGSARWITGLMKTSPIYAVFLADKLFAYINLREAWFRDFEIETPQSLEDELDQLTDDEIELRLSDESLYEKPENYSGQEYEIRPHPAKMNLNMKEIAALRLIGEDVLGYPIEMTMAEYLESRGVDINARRRVFPLVRKLLFFYDLDTGLIQTVDPNIEGINESITISFDETGKRVLSDAGAIGKPEQKYMERKLNKKLLFAVNYRSDDLLLPSLATAKMVLQNNRPLIVVNQSGEAKIWVSKGRVSADEFAVLENHATGWHNRVYNYFASSDIQINRSEARSDGESESQGNTMPWYEHGFNVIQSTFKLSRSESFKWFSTGLSQIMEDTGLIKSTLYSVLNRHPPIRQIMDLIIYRIIYKKYSHLLLDLRSSSKEPIRQASVIQGMEIARRTLISYLAKDEEFRNLYNLATDPSLQKQAALEKMESRIRQKLIFLNSNIHDALEAYFDYKREETLKDWERRLRAYELDHIKTTRSFARPGYFQLAEGLGRARATLSRRTIAGKEIREENYVDTHIHYAIFLKVLIEGIDQGAKNLRNYLNENITDVNRQALNRFIESKPELQILVQEANSLQEPHERKRIRQKVERMYNQALLKFSEGQLSIDEVRLLESYYQGFSDDELLEKSHYLRKVAKENNIDQNYMRRHGLALFSVVLARKFQILTYDEQILAAGHMLDGLAVEQATGEGKTISIALAAYVKALTGEGVHIHTFNDYLASRDGRKMAEVFNALGMSVGILHSSTPYYYLKKPSGETHLLWWNSGKRKAYLADVTYGKASQFIFDFLRDEWKDKTSREIRLQRLTPPAFTFVDEGDSVLIDEAFTQNTISNVNLKKERKIQKGKFQRIQPIYLTFYQIAKDFERWSDYLPIEDVQQIKLAKTAFERILEDERVKRFGLSQTKVRHLLTTALMAREFYHRDEHYIIANERVVIVDDYTGRLKPLSLWDGALHYFVTAKEIIEREEDIIEPKQQVTVNTISTFSYYSRIKNLAAISGTMMSAKEELYSLYGISSVAVAKTFPQKRVDHPFEFLPSNQIMFKKIFQQSRALHEKGIPVLIITGSIYLAHQISAYLYAHGLDHNLLTGKNENDEEKIISQAGRAGAITVSTNMIGRGTDIRLSSGVSKMVSILAGLDINMRVHRQRRGRVGRQGQVGDAFAYYSGEDPLVHRFSDDLDAHDLIALADEIAAEKRLGTHAFDRILEAIRYRLHEIISQNSDRAKIEVVMARIWGELINNISELRSNSQDDSAYHDKVNGTFNRLLVVHGFEAYVLKSHRSELREVNVRGLRESLAVLKRSGNVYYDAKDFEFLSDAQRNEFLFLSSLAQGVRIIFYNYHIGANSQLEALSDLEEVILTPLGFEAALKQHKRARAPIVHLSKELQMKAALIEEYEDRLSFFKTVGDEAGTLTAALLWALDGKPEFNLYGITRRDDGLYTVSQNFVESLSQTFENNLAFAWSA